MSFSPANAVATPLQGFKTCVTLASQLLKHRKLEEREVQTAEDKLGATAAGRKEVYACIRGFSKVRGNEP